VEAVGANLIFTKADSVEPLTKDPSVYNTVYCGYMEKEFHKILVTGNG
jgi:hypothetical protein